LACESVKSEPEPLPEPKIFKYVYTGTHEIRDFNVYAGSDGRKLPLKTEDASLFFGKNSLLGRPYYDTLIIDFHTKTLYKKTEFSTLEEELVINDDTLGTAYNNREYYGVFTDDSTFVMNRAHYYIHYDGRETSWNPYSVISFYGYWRKHEKAIMTEFFHENSRFRNLSDMTLASDTIAWLTEYYQFRLSESY
jgi:hypothetical protein